jgi:hypothetical protein
MALFSRLLSRCVRSGWSSSSPLTSKLRM